MAYVPPGRDWFLRVARGDVAGSFIVHKFGRRSSIATAADIWSGPGDDYTYPTAAAQAYISSSSLSDTQNVTVQGLDASGDQQEVTQALAGQTKTALGSATWTRIFRAWNADAGTWPAVGTPTTGDVYVYEDDTITAGVPDTDSKVKAKIDIAHQQTLMGLYTVPAGYKAYVYQVWANGARSLNANAAAANFTLQAREPGGVFRTKLNWSWHNYGGAYQEAYHCPNTFGEMTDLKVACDGVSATIDAGGGFDILLEPK